MKNITLSADEHLIEKAREKAQQEHTTLNDQFRLWLTEYVGVEDGRARAMQTIRELQKTIRTGGYRFTRDEMNER